MKKAKKKTLPKAKKRTPASRRKPPKRAERSSPLGFLEQLRESNITLPGSPRPPIAPVMRRIATLRIEVIQINLSRDAIEVMGEVPTLTTGGRYEAPETVSFRLTDPALFDSLNVGQSLQIEISTERVTFQSSPPV